MSAKSVVLTLIIATTVILSGFTPASGQTPVPAGQVLPDGVFVVRVYYNTVEDIKLLASYDVFEYNNLEEKYVLVAVDSAGLKGLQALGFRAVVDPEETANFAPFGVAGPVQIETIPGYSCYRTVEETYAAAQAIVTAHPTLATWTDVGDSWEKSVGQPDGYDLMVLKLTNSNIPGPKPKLFVTASIHAREYATAELVMRFGEYLVNNYDSDADANWLLDHHEVHLMLYVNPDGRKEAEAGASWRKNTNENYCGVTSSNRGADLNRNFAFQWGGAGASAAPCDATYRGASAASEPETQAVQNYVNANFSDQRGPNLTDPAPSDATGVWIDVHSYGRLVLWPWGFTNNLAPNATQLQTLGRKYAYYNSYTPQQSYALYPTSGANPDHGYGTLGIASYVFEVGTAFFQSCTYFTSTLLPANLPALIYAAKVARTPYMTPAGPDAINLALSASTVPQGTAVTLSATINDTRYRSGTGEPTQNIAAAEYYVDVPPWLSGTPYALAATDGSFNATAEGVTTSVDTTYMSPGKHIIFVRGQDANGNWGAFSAVFLSTSEPTAVELLSFTATVAKKAIILSWETASEIDNLGFNLYRAPSVGGLKTKLNAALIPTLVYPGSPFGAVYSYHDTTMNGKKLYFYWLEDVDIYGRTELHGPVEARVR